MYHFRAKNDACFSKKIILQGKWAILGPKLIHGHNSGSAVRSFSKFWSIKGLRGISKSY